MNNYYKWKENGGKIPPPEEVKHEIILNYQDKYKCECFIETGTLFGNTTNAVKDAFSFIFTVELSQEFALKAAQRFKDDEKIKVICGDSGTFLKQLLKPTPTNLINRNPNEIENININVPIFFWIDSHRSATTGVTNGPSWTPIRTELSAIANHHMRDSHIILIDDVRDFKKGRGDYPTVIEMEEFFHKGFPFHDVLQEDDIWRLVPKGA